MVVYAMSRADLVIIPTQASFLDAVEAVAAVQEVKQQEEAFRASIPAAVLFTRTSAAIRTRTLASIEAEFRDNGVPVFNDPHSSSGRPTGPFSRSAAPVRSGSGAGAQHTCRRRKRPGVRGRSRIYPEAAASPGRRVMCGRASIFEKPANRYQGLSTEDRPAAWPDPAQIDEVRRRTFPQPEQVSQPTVEQPHAPATDRRSTVHQTSTMVYRTGRNTPSA